MEKRFMSPTAEEMRVYYAEQDEKRKKEEENKKPPFKNVEFDKKYYLTNSLILGKGEEEKTVVFRPIPFFIEDKNQPSIEIASHGVKKGSEFKYHICLKHTKGIEHLGLGEKCAFCEAREIALEKKKQSTTEAEKKLWGDKAYNNRVIFQYIMKGIDRDLESDGLKFWKFNKVDKGNGNWDKISKLDKLRNNESVKAGRGGYTIYDYYEGKDLNIEIKKSLNKDGKEVQTISTITDSGEKSPLHQDENIMAEWINSDLKWFDIFKPKPYEYNKIIAGGGTPFYFKEKKIWTDKDELDTLEKAGKTPIYDEDNNMWVDEEEYNKENGIVSEIDEIEHNEEEYRNYDNNTVSDDLPF